MMVTEGKQAEKGGNKKEINLKVHVLNVEPVSCSKLTRQVTTNRERKLTAGKHRKIVRKIQLQLKIYTKASEQQLMVHKEIYSTN